MDDPPAVLLSSLVVVYVCQTPVSIFFATLLISTELQQGCPAVKLWVQRSDSCILPVSFHHQLALTPHAGIPPPPSHSHSQSSFGGLMLHGGGPAANGKNGRENKGGESSWKRMTSPVQPEKGGGDGRWHKRVESRGETALDGLAAEQRRVRESDGQEERMRAKDTEKKEREHLHWSGGNIKTGVWRQLPLLPFVRVTHKLQKTKRG